MRRHRETQLMWLEDLSVCSPPGHGGPVLCGPGGSSGWRPRPQWPRWPRPPPTPEAHLQVPGLLQPWGSGGGAGGSCLTRPLRPPGLLEGAVPGPPHLQIQKLLRPVQRPRGAWASGWRRHAGPAQDEPRGAEGRGLEWAGVCGPPWGPWTRGLDCAVLRWARALSSQ